MFLFHWFQFMLFKIIPFSYKYAYLRTNNVTESPARESYSLRPVLLNFICHNIITIELNYNKTLQSGACYLL